MITIDPPIEKMSLAERYDLMARIQETLPPPDPVFSDAHMDLLQARLRAAEEGRNETLDYESAMARLRTSKA